MHGPPSRSREWDEIGADYPYFWVTSGACSAGHAAPSWETGIAITGNGTQELTYPTGIAVPSGDSLCTYSAQLVGATALVSASGYFVPVGSVHAPNNT